MVQVFAEGSRRDLRLFNEGDNAADRNDHIASLADDIKNRLKVQKGN